MKEVEIFDEKGKLIALAANIEIARLMSIAPELLDALIDIYRLVDYSIKNGTFQIRDPVQYERVGRVYNTLCEALGLDSSYASRNEFEQAIIEARKEKK